jgi:hypothetical protein
MAPGPTPASEIPNPESIRICGRRWGWSGRTKVWVTAITYLRVERGIGVRGVAVINGHSRPGLAWRLSHPLWRGLSVSRP